MDTNEIKTWPQAWLTIEQWQALGAHLSNPLTDREKDLILDFLDFYMMQHFLGAKTITPATLYHQIAAFEQLAQSLIPKEETMALKRMLYLSIPLSSSIKNRLEDAWSNLSLNARAAISEKLYLMTRKNESHLLHHPTQYVIAAKLVLADLPKPTKSGGGGNNLCAKKLFFYVQLFDLWRNLGETNLEIKYTIKYSKNDSFSNDKCSQLVGFAYELDKIRYECIRRNDKDEKYKGYKKDTLYKDLRLYKKKLNTLQTSTASKDETIK